jgi:transposase
MYQTPISGVAPSGGQIKTLLDPSLLVFVLLQNLPLYPVNSEEGLKLGRILATPWIEKAPKDAIWRSRDQAPCMKKQSREREDKDRVEIDTSSSGAESSSENESSSGDSSTSDRDEETKDELRHKRKRKSSGGTKRKNKKRKKAKSEDEYAYFEPGRKSQDGWKLSKGAKKYAENVFNQYRKESALKSVLEENPRPGHKFLLPNDLD